MRTVQTLFYTLSLCLALQAQTVVEVTGRTYTLKPMADGTSLRVFGFADDPLLESPVPGYTIEVNEGDSVIIDFLNFSQGAPHTIHLHGLDVNQANDGVPHLSFEVFHMEHGYYRFRAPHAGTYLYHCHVVSSIHVQAGMYAMLIVHPPDGSKTTWEGGYEYHSEWRLMMSEMDKAWHHDSVLVHPYDTSGDMHMVHIPEYHPQYFLVNGLSDQQLRQQSPLSAEVNGSIYLRLANMGFLKNRVIFPPGLNARIVSSDGRPLPVEEETDTVHIHPGERYGVLCSATAEVTDSIRIEYINMNTGLIDSIQYVRYTIEGFLSADDANEDRVAVRQFPNPSDGRIVIDNGYMKVLQLCITNAMGQMVLNTMVIPGRNAMDIQLEPGIYYFSYLRNNTAVTSEKVLIIH